MRKSPRFGMACALSLLALAPAAHAHHWVDPTGGVAIEWQGVIRYVSWDGAHVMYRLEVEDARTGVETWQVLGASPKILARRHIAKTTMKVGERVTVTGWLDPASRIISPTYFVTADGLKYEMGFYPKSMHPAR